MDKKVEQEEKRVNKAQVGQAQEEIMVAVNKKEVAKMEGMGNHNENQMYACV